jgi:hypothetical protein
MSSFWQALCDFFSDSPPQATRAKPVLRPKRVTPASPARPRSARFAATGIRPKPEKAVKPSSPIPISSRPAVRVLEHLLCHPAVPYWQLRGWRQVRDGLYLGYFKTRIGSRHGVVKWNSPYDFAFYVHNIPTAILNGPHGACFVLVKPGKYRVHFAQYPKDINSAIFYIETLLQEAFEK